MPITRNAEDYESTDSDREVLKEIDEAVENVTKSLKVEMAFIALYLFTRPNGDPNTFAPGTIDSITLISNLSPGGKLKLAGDLIEDVRL